jgi:hypothetical protein
MDAMFGLVHRDHRPGEHRAHHVAQESGREGLVISQHRYNLVEAEDVNGARSLGRTERRFSPHRTLSTGCCQSRVRIVDVVEMWQRGAKIDVRPFDVVNHEAQLLVIEVGRVGKEP